MRLLKIGHLIPGSIHDTKTAAGHFARGYRGGRFGKSRKPRNAVVVRPVGNKWGVYDRSPKS